jgi:hypothetical protein
VSSWYGAPRTFDGLARAEVDLVHADCRPRFNDVGTYSVSTPFLPAVWARLGPGSRFDVRRDARGILHGPLTDRELVVDADWPDGLVEISGLSDEVLLEDRICLPTPSLPWTQQTQDTHWTMTAPAETVMKALVSANTGPNALPNRRVADLLIEPDQGRGAVVSVAIRYGNLLTELQAIAAQAGLGFRVTQTVDGRIFTVFDPVDRSASVVFSMAAHNLEAQRFTERSPSVTDALAAGAGEGRARMVREYSTTSPAALAYRRRIETFVDRRDSEDPQVLVDSATKAVDDGAPSQALPLTVDGEAEGQYGEAWADGDVVAVQVGPLGYTDTAAVTDVIREVRFLLDPDTAEDSCTPVVGSAGATADALSSWLDIRDLGTRIDHLERSL